MFAAAGVGKKPTTGATSRTIVSRAHGDLAVNLPMSRCDSMDFTAKHFVDYSKTVIRQFARLTTISTIAAAP
jgi:hypothetical protein